jgi:mycothiol synthase
MTGRALQISTSSAAGEVARLVELCDVALDGEQLDRDALDTCCGGPDDVAFWLADGSGVAVVAPGIDHSTRHLQLLAVIPALTGAGRGRALVAAAAEHARQLGATRLELGGAARDLRYLWPGVDVRQLRMLALADSIGTRWSGAAVNLACAASYRSRPPVGVDLRRVIDDADAAAVVAFTAAGFPHWVPELERAIEHGTAFTAVRDGGGPVVGFACHSVNRRGWFGPTGVDPEVRGRGVGAALLAASCRDLMTAGHQSVEISWIGPVAFYAQTAGAAVSRVFRTGWLDLR